MKRGPISCSLAEVAEANIYLRTTERIPKGSGNHSPMTPEEEEVPLVVQSDDLSATELGKRREKGAKKPSDRITEEGGEVIQDELGCIRLARFA